MITPTRRSIRLAPAAIIAAVVLAAACSSPTYDLVIANGRVMDHWRVVLGGNKALEAEVNLAKLVPAAATLPKWRLTFQQWPRDLAIRRNMTTFGWVDLLTLLAANEVLVLSDTGANVLNPGVVEALSGLQDKSSNSASCLVNLLTGKPIFRR